jgi:hypothetical protein
MKPGVRIALLPAVAGASFLLDTSPPVRMAGILFLGILSAYLLRKKRAALTGGMR